MKPWMRVVVMLAWSALMVFLGMGALDLGAQGAALFWGQGGMVLLLAWVTILWMAFFTQWGTWWHEEKLKSNLNLYWTGTIVEGKKTRKPEDLLWW